MSEINYYREYAELAVKKYAERDSANRYMLVDAIGDLEVKKVLDIGCSVGQDLLAFIEKKQAFCVGIDVAEELGIVGNEFADKTNNSDKLNFSRANGEVLPFADESFDVVICQVALPYMHNQKTIAEVSRVLRKDGLFLLKTHAPMFFFKMILERAKTLNPKQIAYPLICLANGFWHSVTGNQMQKGFWNGKEVYQTENFLKQEFTKHGMLIEGNLPDNNVQTPSYLVRKS